MYGGKSWVLGCSQGVVSGLQKLQSGGTQRVLVQYQQQVNVSDGGQAAVACKVAGFGDREARRELADEGRASC